MESPEELQERVDIIRHKLKFIEQKPVVACFVQLNPLVLAGNNIAELMSIAGGTSLAAELVQWQDILFQDPDIIILVPDGYVIESTIKDIAPLIQQPGFANLKAVKNNRLYIADGSKYFKYDEVNTVESVELLAEIINPRQFIFGYEGEGWIKFGV